MLADPPPRRKTERSNGIASAGAGIGLSAEEFTAAADSLLRNGLHPVAIGKLDPDRPDKPPGKAPWHKGVTGYRGQDVHPDTVEGWPGQVANRIAVGERGILNLGMRMPVGGIGIDVDAYDGKRGLQTIAEREARLGELPAHLPHYRTTV